VPRFTYSVDRKKFISDDVLGVDPPKLYADASKKAEIYNARYKALRQRTARHKLFTPAVVGSTGSDMNSDSNNSSKKYQLKAVDFLLGTTSKLDNVIVLGMLTQIKHGKYSLEDPTGSVDLDMTEAKFHRGLYTENCFVLVEGWYEDLVFHVLAMGHPPAESSETSRAFLGTINMFGGPLEVTPKACKDLLKIEQMDSGPDGDAMFVFLSDVWLDSPAVVSNLAKLFAGYASIPPTAFVFMGNFIQDPPSGPGGLSTHAKNLKEHFRILANMICEHEALAESSKFIFLPGSNDPGYPNIFPRPALPNYIMEDMIKKLPVKENCHFVSNPCRIQYCTQEIVLFREDIVTKMCRNCVYFPENGDIPSHFGRTLVSQGHLAPLPQHICPVYWDYDRSMWIYPLPDVVVIGDKFDPFTTESIQGCTIVNPGSFAKNAFAFKTYVPKTRVIEDSQIPPDE